jgi:hypothetical protein
MTDNPPVNVCRTCGAPAKNVGMDFVEQRPVKGEDGRFRPSFKVVEPYRFGCIQHPEKNVNKYLDGTTDEREWPSEYVVKEQK